MGTRRCKTLDRMGADAVAAHRRNVMPAVVLRTASDQRLAAEVRAGSERAFELLFDRYHRPILAFCRHMLGSREEAEDAVQQTFMTAFRELADGEQPRALRPWLYGIARHRCQVALRGRVRRSDDGLPDRGADQLLAQVTTREDLREILADVAQLPFDQRAALVLAELGDVSHAEIASVVGCPRAKVKALVFQARASLAAGRAARELSCVEVRKQLATLRGGALRRRLLRRHLRDCAACRAFRDRMRGTRLGLALPALPALLKRTILGTLTGSGGGAGGTALTTGALSAAGATAAALLAVAIPGGPLAEALGPAREARESRPAASAVKADPAVASPVRTRGEAPERLRSGGGPAGGHVSRSVVATGTAGGRRVVEPAPGADARRPARPDRGGSERPVTPAEPANADPHVEPASRARPEPAGRGADARSKSEPAGRASSARSKPPHANGPPAPLPDARRAPLANGRSAPPRVPRAPTGPAPQARPKPEQAGQAPPAAAAAAESPQAVAGPPSQPGASSGRRFGELPEAGWPARP